MSVDNVIKHRYCSTSGVCPSSTLLILHTHL